jgi:hypothetical protein
MAKSAPAIAGTGAGATNENQAPGPGALFGVPKYGTQRRFVPDQGNSNIGTTLNTGGAVPLATTKLDQLDIVIGEKIYLAIAATYTTGEAMTLTVGTFYPASLVSMITFQLQAAYNTFQLSGALASIIQWYRPMWGSRQVGTINPDPFAATGNPTAPTTAGVANDITLAIDIPFAIRFEEYFDLDQEGDATGKYYDALVSPTFMAAQSRNVTPIITMAQGLTVSDLLGGGVTKASDDTLSTFSGTVVGSMYRDAYWTASNPAGNPTEFPWLYTRASFSQPTNGQAQVGCLIQNTGISVGQVLSLFGFCWDGAADSGLGAIVPFSSIARFELVTGGTLQNINETPAAVADRMRSMYGASPGNDGDNAAIPPGVPDGVFVFDFALDPDGGFLTNANAINTYLVNGVQLNIYFNAGDIPSSTATVYVGVEALKYATS